MPTVPVVAATQSAVIVGGLIVIPQLLVVAVADPPGVESVTFTVKLNGPAVVGVPLMMPVAPSRDNPFGSDPLANTNVYGAVPPCGTIAELYGVPTVPVVAATQSAVIVGGVIVIPQLGVVAVSAVPPVESVTFTVKLNGPAVVGVPLITPVDVFSVNPFGSDPEFSAYEYGGVPPLACTCDE